MTTPTHAPIKHAVVTRIRANTSLKNALTGIFEGWAPEETKYPFAVYTLVAGAYEWDHTNVTVEAVIDISVFSRNPVEADNLDEDLAAWLSDQPFPVEGQRTMTIRRIATLPTPPDMDSEGKKVWQVGGSYEIQADVKLTPRIFTVGAADTTTVTDGT